MSKDNEPFGRKEALRTAQLRLTWIANIIRIQGVSQEEAEKMYIKIDPHKTNQK